MKQFLAIATLGVALLGSVSFPAHANLITDGSFESPVVPVGSFTNFGPGPTIPGWTVVGPQVSIVSGTFTQNGISFPAQDGAQWLDLTGLNANSPLDGVQQSVATTPAQSYELSYFVGNVVNPGGIFGTTSTVKVLVDGTLVQTATNSGGGGTTQTWEQFTTSFMATGSTTTIEFLNGDPANDNTNGLDNVVLNATGGPTGVPEPSTLLLLGSGLAGLGGIVWRRNRR